MTGESFRWGIAATGGIAERFAHALAQLDDAELVAVGSRSSGRARSFGDRLGVPHRHGSYESLAADPTVDVVYVASPNTRHEHDALLFLDAGKHVLCEKPFALNRDQAERMVHLAEARGVFLMEAMWSRFLPAYRLLGELLGAGRIGAPLVVEADFGMRVPLDPGHRLFDRGLGGGALLDLGPYPVQLASLVLGTPDGVTARAHIGDTGVDEQVAAVLHHPGGELAVVKAALRVGLSCTARISGTDGWIGLPSPMHCPDHLVVGGASGIERHDCPVDGEGLRYEVAEVHRCLREGLLESPLLSLSETCDIAGTLDAARGEIGLVYPGEAYPAT